LPNPAKDLLHFCSNFFVGADLRVHWKSPRLARRKEQFCWIADEDNLKRLCDICTASIPVKNAI
jgi:hypothetical protein